MKIAQCEPRAEREIGYCYEIENLGDAVNMLPVLAILVFLA